MWWLVFPALVIVFLAVIIIRAVCFKPVAQKEVEIDEAPVDADKAINDLASMIRVKTVSYYDEALMDKAEFERFRELLKTLFPTVHGRCTLTHVGRSGIIYKLEGAAHDKPSVFMAHYDVVPVVEEAWEKPPFEGLIEDGILWGRGTLDTKGTLCGVLEGAETLLKEGFVPKQDMYFAFAGDEEINGLSAPVMVQWFKDNGVVPALVVDEGGAVVENIFPGVSEPCALIGTAEKGLMNVSFTFEGQGGHASAPKPHTPVGVLAKAVCDVENAPFKRSLTPPVAGMFDTLGRHSSFAMKLIFANLWCFLPLLDAICKKSGGELNAMMRTTCAFTQMYGSKAPNVIPPSAKIVANIRIIGGETNKSVISELEKRVNNPAIKVREVDSMNPSKNSVTGDESWDKLVCAIRQTWPEALVSPYLMVACSDSRQYCAISDNVYRFSAMALTADERSYIHGNNERIPVEKIVLTAKFYYRLLKQC